MALSQSCGNLINPVLPLWFSVLDIVDFVTVCVVLPQSVVTFSVPLTK